MSIGLRVVCLAVLTIASVVTSAGSLSARSYIAYEGHLFTLGPVGLSLRSGRRTLPGFFHRGSFYVLGQRGMRYSIFIQNRTRQRLEVVVAVDGRDVITGERSSTYSRRGYVLNPYRYVNISGFRASKTHVASFRFTSIGRSYAARMGSSWFRVGNIHVAVFRERRPIAFVPRPTFRGRRDRPSYRRSVRWQGRRSRAAAPLSAGKAAKRSADSVRGVRWRRPPRPTNRPSLGTGYGRLRHAPASFTTFRRLTSYPSYRLTLRYNNCAGFRRSRICTRLCPCVRRSWPYRKYKPKPRSRYAPPPP